MKRRFAESLLDLVKPVQSTGREEQFVRVVKVYFDLPFEVSIHRDQGEVEFLGDVPNWRWRTIFDLPTGRLRISCELGDAL